MANDGYFQTPEHAYHDQEWLREVLGFQRGTHRQIAHIVDSRLAGYTPRPAPEEIATALHSRAPDGQQRALIALVFNEADIGNSGPRETLAVMIEENLSLRQLAHALRSAGITNARITGWLNARSVEPEPEPGEENRHAP